MARRRRSVFSSDSDEEEAGVVEQYEMLATQDDDVKNQSDEEQYSEDTPAVTKINDLPNEIFIMILKKVDRKSQVACRIVNRRFNKIVNEHLIYCDKPKNCYYSKKDESLVIGELESEEEVAALRKRIQYPTILKSVVIDWEELWGQSTFNDAFLFRGPRARVVNKMILKANKIGTRNPDNLVKVFEVCELTLDFEQRLDASNIEELLKKLCRRYDSTVHYPRGQPLAPFMDAVREINKDYCASRRARGQGWIMHPPKLGVAAQSGDDLLQIVPQIREQFIRICDLEVTITNKEQASNFHKIFKTNAKSLLSLKINMSTTTRIKDKPLLLVFPFETRLKKLELIVVGPGEDEKGRMLPSLIKFRFKNEHQDGTCVKKTFPYLRRLCLQPPMVTDDEKWDAISRVYYKQFLFVRQPDDDSPLGKWSPRIESLELGFPPKTNGSFGGDKYQRFCLELSKMFNVDKAVDTNNGEEVKLSRFN